MVGERRAPVLRDYKIGPRRAEALRYATIDAFLKKRFYMKYWKECVLIILILALTNAFADTVTIVPIGDSEIEQHSADLNLGSATMAVSGALGASAGFEIRREIGRASCRERV